MLLINAVNAAGRPVELFVKDGKIAAVGPAFVDLHCTGAPRALNIRRTSPPEAWLRPQAATPLST